MASLSLLSFFSNTVVPQLMSLTKIIRSQFILLLYDPNVDFLFKRQESSLFFMKLMCCCKTHSDLIWNNLISHAYTKWSSLEKNCQGKKYIPPQMEKNPKTLMECFMGLDDTLYCLESIDCLLFMILVEWLISIFQKVL